jgi:integrase
MGKLTVATVKGMTKPGRYADGGGLFLDVRGGSRAWVYRYQLATKERLMSLGSVEAVSLAEARARHAAAVALVRGKRDPLNEREQAKAVKLAEQAMTFGAAVEAYIQAHRSAWRGRRSEEHWRSTMALHVLPHIGAKPVRDIGTDDVLKVLSPIWSIKNVTAVIVRSRVELTLSYARSMGWRDGPNPAAWRDHMANLLAKPGRVHRVEHRAAMDWREAPEVMARLADKRDMAAKALQFAMLTCVRSREARGCRWSEIDTASATWTIPAERMKGAREHRVPLAPGAMEVLAEAAEVRQGELVFWGRGVGMMDPNTLTAALRRAGCADGSVHGMRSTFRDWCADHGEPADIAEMALAHTVGSAVERSYRRSDVLERRRGLMGRWAQFLLPRDAAVVPLRRAG